MSALSLKNMSAEAATKAGEELASMLGLKKDKQTQHYNTQWGSKTAEGLGRCMYRIIAEATTEPTVTPDKL